MLEASETDTLDPGACETVRVMTGKAVEAGTDRDVVDHVLPGEDRVALEHVADARRDAGHQLAVDADGAEARRFEAGDEREGRGLAAARWPDDSAELALDDPHVESAQRGKRRAGGRHESLRHARELDGDVPSAPACHRAETLRSVRRRG